MRLALDEAYKALKDSPQFENYTVAQKKVIDNALRDFHLSGIDLPAEQQKRYGEISKRLSELTSKFAENVLDCTNAFSKHITDVNELSGLPETQLHGAEIAAKAVKEAAYHVERSGDTVIGLGDGTDESHRRMQAALDLLWPYVGEMFVPDSVDDAMAEAFSLKDRLVFLDIHVDPGEHVYPMHIAPNGSMRDMWLNKAERTS